MHALILKQCRLLTLWSQELGLEGTVASKMILFTSDGREGILLAHKHDKEAASSPECHLTYACVIFVAYVPEHRHSYHMQEPPSSNHSEAHIMQQCGLLCHYLASSPLPNISLAYPILCTIAILQIGHFSLTMRHVCIICFMAMAV